MDSQPTGKSTQVGSRGEYTPTSSSDQGKALVAAAGQLVSWSVQLFDCVMLGEQILHHKATARGGNPTSKTTKVSDQKSRIPLVMLDGNVLQRSESLSSLSSIESAASLVSAFTTSSNMAVTDSGDLYKEMERDY